MVFSGDRGFEVTNNSYYTDPWLFNCPDNADQDAILEGVKRAVAYAEGKGVLNVAAAGNENYNLAAVSSASHDHPPIRPWSCSNGSTRVSGGESVAKPGRDRPTACLCSRPGTSGVDDARRQASMPWSA